MSNSETSVPQSTLAAPNNLHGARGVDTALGKVAQVTFLFWVMKIIATTLGETAGDFISMTLGLGYFVGLAITFVLLMIFLSLQISAARFHIVLFWVAIVATTTMGTEVSDLMDRTLGLGYVGGASLLAAGLAVTLGVWYLLKKDLGINPIVKTDTEILFWIAVIFSNSLGTAFGDALSDAVGLSYIEGALVTAAVMRRGAGAALYATRVNEILLFWIAFVFTRPFGATFGRFSHQTRCQRGLALSRLDASLVAVVLLAVVMFISSRRWFDKSRL